MGNYAEENLAACGIKFAKKPRGGETSRPPPKQVLQMSAGTAPDATATITFNGLTAAAAIRAIHHNNDLVRFAPEHLLVKALGHIPWVVNVDPRAWSCSQRFHDWALFRTLHVSDDLLPVSVGNLQNNLREPWAGASAQPPALVTGAGIASETHSKRSLKSLPAASLCKAGHIALADRPHASCRFGIQFNSTSGYLGEGPPAHMEVDVELDLELGDARRQDGFELAVLRALPGVSWAKVVEAEAAGERLTKTVRVRGGGCAASKHVTEPVLEMTDIKPYIKPTEVVEPGAGTATEAEAAMTRRVGGDETNLNPNCAVEPADGSWRTAAWLDSQGLAAAAIAQALHSTGCTSDELAATCALASLSEEALAAQLEKGGLANVLARGLRPSLLKLTQEVTAGAELREQHGKFHQDGVAFELKFGEIRTFFAGLEAQIGPPEVHVALAIEFEHTSAADSNDAFTTSNYGVLTTPRTEYWFVAEPERDVDWPTETKLADSASAMRRRPLPSKELGTRLGEKNVELRSLGEPELLHEEGVGARLYTGPMYVKYDAILRGFGPALNGCKGNRYVTTIHAINSAIVKASKLTKAAKVYRGVSGGVLPERFWTANKQGVRGGVERAFLSTTYERDVAIHYASSSDSPSIVFEIQMGMVDRGCDLGWLSQYPHERECLFGPLTGFELLGTRVEGRALVAKLRLSVNLNALTIEQVLGKMKQSQLDLVHLVRDGMARQEGMPPDALVPFESLRSIFLARERTWFNSAANYKHAVAQVFAARDAACQRAQAAATAPTERDAKPLLSGSPSTAAPAPAARGQERRRAGFAAWLPTMKAARVVAIAEERPLLQESDRSRRPALSTVDPWTTIGWLASAGAVVAVIARALHGPDASASDELSATRSLASMSEDALAARLRMAGLYSHLAHSLHLALRQLAARNASAASCMNLEKFHQQQGTFELTFANQSTFYGGLEAQIGPPEVHVALAIEFEHTSAADSNDAFTTSNYGVLTTPRTEYWFVAEPERDVDWPTETKLADSASAMRRRPLPSKELGTRLGEKNVELRSLGEPELLHEEGVGARLYTGPMYVKYDAILRGFGPALNGCKGNRYVTTIHAINSAIVKASKLTKAAKVYRGVSGGVLPEALSVPNEYNVKGGIETSFMSTSRDRDKAMDYAKHGGGVALLFEMELGMINRGADISWLSQYPHEVEVLLPPLTGIELRGSRIEGAVVIYEAVLTFNPNAKTLEQVIAKMRGAHLGLVQLFLDGFVHSAAPDDAVRPLRQLKEAAAAREGAWFNEGAHFQAAAAEAFAARAAVFEALRGRAATWEGAVRTATMCSREGEHGAAIEVLARAKLGVDEPVRNVRLAQWMVKEQKLAPPWPATFAALDDPSLAPLVAPLIREDALEVGKRVLAYGNSGLWKDAVVRAVSADGQSIDVQVGGWKKIGDRPRTKALVVSYAGAGALVRVASEAGCGALVEALLAAGVNPLVADERANTPLHRAAAGGHVAICRALLATGADKDVGNVQDQSAAEAARTAKQHAVVRLFVPTLSDSEFTDEACTRTEQLRAAGKGDVAMLRGTEDEGKITALMVACRAQQLVSVEVLLPSSELDAQSAKGCTALYLAAEEGDVHILRALLAHRAKVELADSDGSTPLMRASCFGHHLCGRILLEAKADPNKATSNGWTALILAAKNGHELCVRVLLEAETDPNKATYDGWTALMASSISGHEPCVRVLLEAKADPNMATTAGVTALMSAAQNGHESCVRVLLEANADPNKAKSNGPTALMLAAQNGHESCVRVLLEAGADRKKEHKWYSGWNALKLAEKRGHAAVCDLLRE